MRLSPWLAPLTVPRSRLADKVVRRKATRRRTFNRLSQMTERLEARTLLTSFTVDSFFDTLDPGPTSLRSAVIQANADMTTGPHMIELGGGIYSLSLENAEPPGPSETMVGENEAMTGDLDIAQNIIIRGQSPFTTIIDARNIDRVFEVLSGGTLTLENLTVTGGNVDGFGEGGGIRVDGGTLNLINVVLTENRATFGGGIFNSSGMVTITDSTLSFNRVFSSGGAIESNGGTLTVQQSTISENNARNAGGGISTGAGMVDIINSTIANNSVGEPQSGFGEGGGVYVQVGGNVDIIASTVAFNMAENEGGGLWVDGGSLTVERTIVSDNNVTSGMSFVPDDVFTASGTTVASNDYNIIRANTGFGFSVQTNDRLGIDPFLMPLADNGGPTQTIALGGMSPAIDAGPTPLPSVPFLNGDQRGFRRERDGDRDGETMNTDIGAFELQSPSDVFVDAISDFNIVDGRVGDFIVTDDANMNTMLDDGDEVTFGPLDGSLNVAGLIFGTRAFGDISSALSEIRMRGTDPDSQYEIILASGTYAETVTLDIMGSVALRGHAESGRDSVIIDPDGTTATGISVTEFGVTLESLSVTGAGTGIDVNISGSPSFGQNFDARNVNISGNTTGLNIEDEFSPITDVSILDSTFAGNAGDGIKIDGVLTALMRNVSSTGNTNGGDGIEITNAVVVGLDTVTVTGNDGRGLNINDSFGFTSTVAIMDPRTLSNVGGNLINGVDVLMFKGVAGDVANSTTITGSAIQFDAGADAAQEDIDLSNVFTAFVTGDGGNDEFTIDYSGGGPSGRQLFIDGGSGRDRIGALADGFIKVDEDNLTIFVGGASGFSDVIAITSFEEAELTGGGSANRLIAGEFEGAATLNGGNGDDTLEGTAGDDLLNGGAGNDVLRGGPIHEQYIFGETSPPMVPDGFGKMMPLDLDAGGMGVTSILNTFGQGTATIDLSMTGDQFQFGDVQYFGTSLFVTESGVISFGGPVGPQDNFDLNNVPGMLNTHPIIAPLFDDWVTGLSGTDSQVLYRFDDAEGIRRLVIEWNDVFHRSQLLDNTPRSGASPVTFQVILELNTFDRDGDITFNYLDLETNEGAGTDFDEIANGQNATIGGKDRGDNPIDVRQIAFGPGEEPTLPVASGTAILAQSQLTDGNDVLNGGDGNDILLTTTGNDILDGGSGTADELILEHYRSPFQSDHDVVGNVITSTFNSFDARSYEFDTSYSNIERLSLNLGPADQNVSVDLDGLPAAVSSIEVEAHKPTASDRLTIFGTTGADNFVLTGDSITVGTRTIKLNGVEELTLDISQGNADTVLIDQDFSGSARDIIVTGDSSDDSISLESTANPQLAGVFGGDGLNAHLDENRGGGTLLLEEVISDATNQAAPDDVVISPDGSRVYVAAFGSNSLVVYDRNRITGDLTLVETLIDSNPDFNGMMVSGLKGATSVAVSNDGQYIYVTSEDPTTGGTNDGAIAFFVHHPGDNQLTFISSTPLTSDLPTDVTLTPDGAFLLVTTIPDGGTPGGRVMIFGLEQNGDPQFLGSLDDGGLDGSGSTMITGLAGAEEIAISPDGQTFYVTALDDDSVSVFSRPGDDGQTSGLALPLLVQTVTNGVNSVTGLDGASSVAISPDGRHVYVTGEDSDAVAVFDRSASDGMLTFVESLTGISTLLTPTSVTVSPDGQLVYVAAEGSNAVNVFDRNAGDGKLTFRESLQNGGVDTENDSISGLTEVFSLAASDDGLNLYAVGTGADSVVRFNTPRRLSVLSDGAADLSVTTSDSDDMIAVGLVGLPASVTIDAGGSVDSDMVNVTGSASDDTVGVDGGTLTFGGATTLTLSNAENLDVFTDDGNDTVNVLASSSGPANFSVNGGTQSGADVLNVDAQTAQADDSGSVITFSGSRNSVNYSGFETPVAITNASPRIDNQVLAVDDDQAIGSSVGRPVATDADDGTNLTWSILSGPGSGDFSIDSIMGDIATAADLDNQTTPQYMLTVQVEDPGGLTDTAIITINVNDRTAPTPVISSSDPDPTNSALIPFTIDFGEIVNDFLAGDVSISGGMIMNFAEVDGTFSFDVAPDGDGPITVDVAANAAADAAGNNSVAAAQFTIESDQTVSLDFGDAPASFATLLVDDGPRHVIGSLFLGSDVDAEADGQPDAAALRDDNNSTGGGPIVDDEDGITFLSALGVGATRQFRVFASEAGFIDAWIDFDQSGDFNAGENLSSSSLIILDGGSASSSGRGEISSGGGEIGGGFDIGTGIAVPAGFSTVSFDIPSTAIPGPTIARFRLSGAGGLGPTGPASDGEVEDYLVEIAAPPVGNSDSIEPALNVAVEGFFNAFPDELNDPDPNIVGDELPLAVQAENGATAERRIGAPPLDQTDAALRTVIQAINDAVDRLEQDRGPDEYILVVATHPVDFLLADTQGRTVGFTQDAGSVNEIGADATFTGDGIVELLTIRNADAGEYGLQLVGVGGVFRGGASLITPVGTQEITFQGSLADSDEVQLALTYQEVLTRFPTRTDLETVDFSEIADFVAQIPTIDDNAKTSAAGATEALASIALDRLDASLFSRKDDEEAALQALLERISLARKKLVDAIKTSLDEDELESLKLVFGDDAEEADSVEVLARVLLETLSGPLISAPRQVKDLSGRLQQLLEQLQEQRKNQQKQQDNQQPANSNEPKGAAKPETEDKRTSQRSPDRTPAAIVNSTFIVSTDDVAARQRVKQTAGLQNSTADSGTSREQVRRPKFISRTDVSDAAAPENANAESSSETRGDTSVE